MSALKAFFLDSFAGAPVWAWLVFGVVFPIANEVVERVKWIKGQSILQAIARILLTSPVIGKIVQMSPLLGDLIRLATGNAYVRATMPKAGIGKLVSGAPPSAAMIPIFCLGFLTVPACAQAKAVGVECGAPEAIKIVANLVSIVAQALASPDGQTVLGKIEADLVKQGIADAPSLIICAIDHILAKSKVAASPLMLKNAEAYKAKHRAKGSR